MSRAAWAFAAVLAVLASVVGAFALGRAQSAAAIDAAPKGDREALALYAEALQVVREDYVGKGQLDPEAQAHGGIEGMLASLGDGGHTRFLSPEERKLAREGLSGSYVGVGVELEQEGRRVLVSSPLAGSPAEEAGVERGDVLMEVGGESVAGTGLEGVIERIKGPEGSAVDLAVSRDGRERAFTLVRSEIDAPAASWGMVGTTPGTAVVALSSFSDGSAEDLLGAFEEARKAGAEAFVLDLRGNPGGELDEAEKSAAHFLRGGSAVYVREEADGSRDEITVPRSPFAVGDGPAVTERLVVLVDGRSASSSEILAGALGDNGRARIVGERTAGTGTVLSEFPLEDGSSVLLGVAEWLTPRGDFIRDSGLTPDVEVGLEERQSPLAAEEAQGLSEAELSRTDAQLDAALEEVERVRVNR